jgi:hypothetical protein
MLTDIHQKVWCGANFVIKLSDEPKQHQIHRITISMLPFCPSNGTHRRDICVGSTVLHRSSDLEQQGRASLKSNCRALSGEPETTI